MRKHSVYPNWGNKKDIADVVWRKFGKVDVFIDPFAGSNSIALGNPHYKYLKREILNDHNGYMINFWRSIKYDFERVAFHMDFPSSHIQLIAIYKMLRTRFDDLPELLRSDPFYYDPICAGLWCYLMCETIDIGRDLHVGKKGYGSIPNIGSTKGSQVRRAPTLHNANQDNEWKFNGERLHGWYKMLSDRFRAANILCKDWTDLYSLSLLGQTSKMSDRHKTAIFFDPPYGTENMEANKYIDDSKDIAGKVYELALELGENDRNRVALAGYENDYDMPDSWEKVVWKTAQNRYKVGMDIPYSRTECVWFSPHCIRVEQSSFFGDVTL